jgi:hypothetical protein|nr:MAG TPA: Exonuclease [Caudoviricetes sp.]DAV68701.1 MAG TPA: Exonuclease [Caudoviricetes sp.]
MVKSNLTRIAKMVRAGNSEGPASSFVNSLTQVIERTQPEYKPSTYYKPSGVGGCLRQMYFERTGQAIRSNADSNLVAMGEAGTFRHEVLQEYLVKMSSIENDFEWLNVAEFLDKNPVEGTIVDERFKKNDYETKCKNELLQLSFLCDGLIRYRGKLYILEIKTETMFKFTKHTEPYEEHKMQATCYGMCLGVDDVMFLYENRDNFEKKAYTFHITDEMKNQVLEKLTTCEEYVEKGESPKIYCSSAYCPYCRKEGRNL